MPLFIGTDTIIRTHPDYPLRDSLTGEVITAVATISCSIRNLDGTPVAGLSNLEVLPIPNSTGGYYVAVPHTASINYGERYRVTIVVTCSGKKHTSDIVVTAQYAS